VKEKIDMWHTYMLGSVHAFHLEEHTLGGANTITWMKHKRRYALLVKGTCMDGSITVVIIECCDDF